MIANSFIGRSFRSHGMPLAWLALVLAACSGGDNLGTIGEPNDSTPAPIDSTPPPDPGDSVPPPDPGDSVVPPPDTNPPPPGEPPTHVGLGFGVTAVPVNGYSRVYNAALQNGRPDSLLAELAAARRANARVLVSFTGNEQWNRDENGFSMTKWKQRVDRFRGLDLEPYIEDGTLFGHFILDEPSDPGNWNGHTVPKAEIEEMARYSKEIWPQLTTIIRAWPEHLKDGNYPSLDATWIQYLERFGDIEDFIDSRIHEAQSLGLSVVAGLNVINGGGANSGMPSYSVNKRAMNASQVRTWGERLLREDICVFLMWEYREDYFARPDIQAAAEHLSELARNKPKRTCDN